jgi:hypothetical protein
MRSLLSRIADHVNWTWLWERLPERWFDQADEVLPPMRYTVVHHRLHHDDSFEGLAQLAGEVIYERQAKDCQREAKWLN